MSATIKALAQLLHAANDFAPEDDPDKYDAWRQLVVNAKHEHNELSRSARDLAALRAAVRDAVEARRQRTITVGEFERRVAAAVSGGRDGGREP